MNAKDLQRKLSRLMDAPSENVGEIMRVSSELAKLDTSRVWFSVDAGLIRRLGQELVARQETALSELIKNAYDADATSVDVVFESVNSVGGTVEITDDGNGMNREELVSGFMRISTSEKVQFPRSPLYGRQRAGRKGIGRFAAQRLGQRLILTTQTQAEATAYQVEINWSDFAPNSELISISSQIKKVKKDRAHGTTLRIEKLAEAWTDAKIERVYRYVMDLLQPTSIFKTGRSRRKSAGPEFEADPGFTPRLSWTSASGRPETADEHSMFLQFAVAKIKAWVDSRGRAWWSVHSDRLPESTGKTEPLAPSKDMATGYPLLKGVSVETSYFILEEEFVPNLLRTKVSDVLARSGGIRVFRNGFRVMPYGQRDDDWLGLDASYSKRSILPSHKNSNFIGFVSLDDPDGNLFEETVSREGLIENDAFEQLRDFAYQALMQAVQRIASIRGKKVRTSDTNRVRPSSEVRRLAEAMRSLAEQDPDQGTRRDDVVMMRRDEVEKISEKLHHVADAQDAKEREALQEIGMLRILASLGILVGQFTHEIRHDLSALRTDLNLLAGLKNAPPEGQNLAQRMKDNLISLQTLASYFDNTLADNVRRELHPQDLRLILGKFRQTVERRSQGITLDIEARGRVITRPMHSSEWMSILLNLYTNSEKAIKRAGVAKGAVRIRAVRQGPNLIIHFADNGCGIPSADQDRVFDAFFTTSAAASPATTNEFQQVQGTGLGLKIVRDTLSSAGGRISLVPPPSGYSTCFEINIPADRA